MNTSRDTRSKIVNVARKVFAQLSVHRTTMDDIAVASQLGRRTLYTYFKSKEELYEAVVNKEITKIIDKLTSVAESELPPKQKFVKFAYQRKKSLRDLTLGNSAVQDDFITNYNRVELLRSELDEREIALLRRILEEGNEAGVFAVPRPELLSITLQSTFKSLEIRFIKENFSRQCDILLSNFISSLLRGIEIRKAEQAENPITN